MVRLTDGEMSDIDERRGGVRRAAWLRSAALESDVTASMPPRIPQANIDLWRDLARAHSNLNQLVHHLNERRDGRLAGLGLMQMQRLPGVVDDLYDQVSALRRQLLGRPLPDDPLPPSENEAQS